MSQQRAAPAGTSAPSIPDRPPGRKHTKDQSSGKKPPDLPPRRKGANPNGSKLRNPIEDKDEDGTPSVQKRDLRRESNGENPGGRERVQSPAEQARAATNGSESPKKKKFMSLFGRHDHNKLPESDKESESEDEDVRKTEPRHAHGRHADKQPTLPEFRPYAKDGKRGDSGGDNRNESGQQRGDRDVPRRSSGAHNGSVPNPAGSRRRHDGKSPTADPYGRGTPRKSNEGLDEKHPCWCKTCGQLIPECEECGQPLPMDQVRKRVRGAGM